MNVKARLAFLARYKHYFAVVFFLGFLVGVTVAYGTVTFVLQSAREKELAREEKQNLQDHALCKPLSQNGFKSSLPVEHSRPIGILDGMALPIGTENTPMLPLAIVVNNGADARPDAGIENAALVYEALVEGGITRFLAVFNPYATTEKIGPVRSARSYFVVIAEELNALFAHVGGSPGALADIRKTSDLIDLNEMGSDEIYFWRSKQRSAPHNTYTSLEQLERAADVKNTRGLSLQPEKAWKFKDDIDESLRPASSPSVLINYSTFNYQVKFEYQPKDNAYLRFMAGGVHQTESGSALTAKNVVVSFVETYLIDELRLGMNLTGEGEAIVCVDGTCKNAVWKKSTETDRTKYYYRNDGNGSDDDEEVAFNRGLTWISLFPKGRESDVSF
jgi:hypothetical protein